MTGLGGVGHLYEIGKYEITNAQFCQFANACAALPDYAFLRIRSTPARSVQQQPAFDSNNRLFENITTLPTKKIKGENGEETVYQFTPKPGFENHPLTVSLTHSDVNGTTRDYKKFITGFIKWMNNGQECMEAAGTQFKRKTAGDTALWFLPTVDELYKAAYHDPLSGTKGVYFEHATGSNLEPSPCSENPTGAKVNAAGGIGTGAAVDSEKSSLLPVGASTPSPYGAFDLTGNAREFYATAEAPSAGEGQIGFSNTFFGADFSQKTLFCGKGFSTGKTYSLRAQTTNAINARQKIFNVANGQKTNGFRLVLIKPDKSYTGMSTTVKADTRGTASFLASAKDGDVWLFKAAAGNPANNAKSWEQLQETIALTTGVPIKKNPRPKLDSPIKENHRGAVIMMTKLMRPAAELEANSQGLNCKPIFNIHLSKDIAALRRVYNQQATKAEQIDPERQTQLANASPFSLMDIATLKQARLKQNSDLIKFKQKIQEGLSKNRPLLWVFSTEVLLNTGKINEDFSSEDATAVIVGINLKTEEVLFMSQASLWHDNRQTMQRAAIKDAFPATLGLYTIDY